MASLSDQILTDSPNTDELIAATRSILMAVSRNDFELLYAISKAMWVGNQLITKLAFKGYVGDPVSLDSIMKNMPQGEGETLKLNKLTSNLYPKADTPNDEDDNDDNDDDFDIDDDDNDDDDFDDAYDDDYDDGDYLEDNVSKKNNKVIDNKKHDQSFNEKKLVFWLESLFASQREYPHKFIAESAKNLGLITNMSQLVKTISKLPVVVGMDMSKTDSGEDPMMVIANPGWPEKTNKPWWMTGIVAN